MVSKGVQSRVEKVCNVVTRVHKAGVASIKRSGTLKLGLESNLQTLLDLKDSTTLLLAALISLFPFDSLFLTVIYVRPHLPTLVFCC